MEYVAGRSLKTIVREQGALDPAAAIDIVVQILRAARFAHRRGVIHRDLKPHNVILDEEGRARVTDFGIARAGASDMTLTGSIMGTAQYLSPEQAQGQPVSAASDLYSVGVILYELLTGVGPVRRRDRGGDRVQAGLGRAAARRARCNPAVPPALDAVVLRALAKDPARALRRRRRVHRGARSRRARRCRSAPVPRSPARSRHGPRHRRALRRVAGRRTAARPRRSRSPARCCCRRPTGTAMRTVAARGSGRGAGAGCCGRSGLLLVAALVVLGLLLASSRGKVTVPNVVGQTEAVALARLRARGPRPGRLAAPRAPRSPSGVVVSQTPSRGSEVGEGLAREHRRLQPAPAAPRCRTSTGSTAAAAVSKLRKAGFKPTTRNQSSSKVAQGHVISTDPSAGIDVQVGSPVTVFVSSGPAQVHVPDVTGQTQTAAEATLTTAGLAVGAITPQVSREPDAGNGPLAVPDGAGDAARRAGTVNLVVAQAPKEVAVPGVVGQDRGARGGGARQSRASRSRRVTEPTSEPAQVGHVLKQSPAAGAQARKGATVTITIGMATETTPTTPTTTTTTPTTTTTTTTARCHADPDPRPVSAQAPLHGRGARRRALVRARGVAVLRRGGARGPAGGRARGRCGSRSTATAPGATTAGRLSVRPGAGLLGADVVVPGAARAVRRGRHGAGAARDARRAVCRRRGGGVGGVHGQGAVQAADGGGGRAAGRLRRRARARAGARRARQVLAEIAALGLPVFVKPAHLGSSVGIVKVSERRGSWRRRSRRRSRTTRW